MPATAQAGEQFSIFMDVIFSYEIFHAILAH